MKRLITRLQNVTVPLCAVMDGFHRSGQQIEEIVPDTWADSVRGVAAFFGKHVMPEKN